MKIAIIADIHANFAALKAVWPKIKSCQMILNAGDLTGYYPEINPVLEIVRRQSRIISILGNHDRYLLERKLPPSISAWVEKPFRYQLKEILPANFEFLKTLKKKMIVEISGAKIGLFHGSPQNPDEYLYPEGDFSQFENCQFDYVILGHTHIPMIKKINKTLIINPGSVGQPRDQDRRASYALLETKTRQVRFKRVNYARELTCQKVEELNFDARLAEILRK